MGRGYGRITQLSLRRASFAQHCCAWFRFGVFPCFRIRHIRARSSARCFLENEADCRLGSGEVTAKWTSSGRSGDIVSFGRRVSPRRGGGGGPCAPCPAMEEVDGAVFSKGLHHKWPGQRTVCTSISLLSFCAVSRGGGWLGNCNFSFSTSSLVSGEGCV